VPVESMHDFWMNSRISEISFVFLLMIRLVFLRGPFVKRHGRRVALSRTFLLTQDLLRE